MVVDAEFFPNEDHSVVESSRTAAQWTLFFQLIFTKSQQSNLNLSLVHENSLTCRENLFVFL